MNTVPPSASTMAVDPPLLLSEKIQVDAAATMECLTLRAANSRFDLPWLDSLLCALGPRELLGAILSAMQGWYTHLLQGGGQTHGAISIGNIMLADPTPAILERYKLFGYVEGTMGVLVDSDEAVEWRDSRRLLGGNLLGNRSFVSNRLLRLHSEPEKDVVYTALDDLESFLWVLINSVLFVVETRKGLSPFEDQWLSRLHERNRWAQLDRENFLSQFGTLPANAGGLYSHAILAFADLICTWRDLACAARADLDKIMDEGGLPNKELCQSYADRYIGAGLACAKRLPTTWDSLFPPATKGFFAAKEDVSTAMGDVSLD